MANERYEEYQARNKYLYKNIERELKAYRNF